MDNVTSISPANITEQIYKKNLELLEDRRRTEQLLYGVSEIVFAVDPNLNITIINHAAEKYLKLNSADVIGMPADVIIHLATDKNEPILSSSYCFNEDPSKGKIYGAVLTTPAGGLYVNVKTQTIFHNDQQSECVVTLSDVTKERELDKTKDEFVNITSHELRTPLTIIKSYLWMLDNGKGGELNAKQKEYLTKAMGGAERMLALINDTLNVARLEGGRVQLTIEKIDLKELYKEIDEEIKIKAEEKNLWYHSVVDPNLWAVYADKSKLREIFLNFLSNAVKYTATGGITVKLDNFGEKEVKVSIIDTGRGVKSEDLPRLFNKFGRLDNSFSTIAEVGGTGLGLYITKSMVEKLGGKVGVESEGLGKGSTFWFTLVSENNKTVLTSLSP